jgi:hypothetical protein
MAGTVMPYVRPQWFTDSGVPAAGYKLFTYAAGTSTKIPTYSDVDLTVANANPIVLDSAGSATVFLSATSYKFVLATPTDTDPPLTPIWTRDDVMAVPITESAIEIDGTAGQTFVAGNSLYLADGAGGTVAGRWFPRSGNCRLAKGSFGIPPMAW